MSRTGELSSHERRGHELYAEGVLTSLRFSAGTSHHSGLSLPIKGAVSRRL